MERIFTSIEEVEKFYYPKAYEKEYEEKIMREGTPKEIGEYIAEKILKEVYFKFMNSLEN